MKLNFNKASMFTILMLSEIISIKPAFMAEEKDSVRDEIKAVMTYVDSLTPEERNTASLQIYIRDAEKGDTKAMVSLGRNYELGLPGIEKNYTRAGYWYRLAAERGDTVGKASLARMYKQGKLKE